MQRPFRHRLVKCLHMSMVSFTDTVPEKTHSYHRGRSGPPEAFTEELTYVLRSPAVTAEPPSVTAEPPSVASKAASSVAADTAVPVPVPVGQAGELCVSVVEAVAVVVGEVSVGVGVREAVPLRNAHNTQTPELIWKRKRQTWIRGPERVEDDVEL